MVRRIDHQHVSRERGSRQPFGNDAAAGRERGLHVLRQSRVVERRTRFLVPHHEPGWMPIGQRHRVNGAEFPDGREQRKRIVEVVCAPRLECPFGRRHVAHRYHATTSRNHRLRLGRRSASAWQFGTVHAVTSIRRE